MARATYVMRDGELVEKHLAAPLHAPSSAAPHVISDAMEPIRSMADGRIYDSKSRYYQGVRAAGCEVVGNERAPFDRRPEFRSEGVGQDIKKAIDQLRSR